MVPVSFLPTLNALLNSTSALLLVTGYLFIRRKRVAAHRACMVSALGVSALFLVSYIYYHAQHGSMPFPGAGWIRIVYFVILIPHVILAAVILPLALVTLRRAWKGDLERHRRLARWTLPLWLFVCASGVAVYWMLYRLY